MRPVAKSVSDRFSSFAKSHSGKAASHNPEEAVVKAEEPLFNLDLLDVKKEDRKWFTSVNTAVRSLLKDLDTPYNYQYMRRIMSNAAHILKEEKKHHEWARKIDPVIVWVACMVPRVGLPEYTDEGKECDRLDVIDEFLKPLGCPLPIRRQAAFLAAKIGDIPHSEEADHLNGFAAAYPAFRIIEDAHRLDEVGAVGITRFIVQRSLVGSRRWDLAHLRDEAVDELYHKDMKTDTGKDMCKRRYRWMVLDFLDHLREDTETVNV